MTAIKNKLKVSNFILEIILLILVSVFAVTAPGFFSANNFFNILRNISMQGIIAFGMTMVMISGDIDLSVGSAVAFSGCVVAKVMATLSSEPYNAMGEIIGVPLMPPLPAITIGIFAALALAVIFGIIAGTIRTKFNVPAFIITLALMAGYTGFANIITNGFPISNFPEWYSFIGGGYIGTVKDASGIVTFSGVPVPAIIFLLVFLISYFVMNYTTFGRSIYAIGGNIEAARLSGIKVYRIKIIVCIIISLLSFISGILLSSQIMAGSPIAAKGWELDVISAVVIGGVSMSGGSGRIWGTFVGVLFLGVILNGMVMLNINEFWQYVVKATLILGAVLLNQIKEKRKA